MTEAQEAVTEQPMTEGATDAVPNPDSEAVEATEATPEVSAEGGSIPTHAERAEKAAFAKQFASLARKERQFRERTQQHKGIEKKASDLDALQDMAQKDPMKFLDKFGISYDALTRRVINDGQPATEDILAKQQQEINELKELNRRTIAEREEAQKKAEYDSTYNSFIDKIKNMAENNTNYELINAHNAYHTVYEVMQEQYALDGTVLEQSQAADMVEQYFADEAERYFKSSKLRERYKGHWQPEKPVEAQDSEPSQQAVAQKPRPKTLSNELTSQTPARDGELLSREESLERAAAILRGGAFS